MMKLGSPLHDRVETIEYLVVKKGKVAEMKPKPIFLLTILASIFWPLYVEELLEHMWNDACLEEAKHAYQRKRRGFSLRTHKADLTQQELKEMRWTLTTVLTIHHMTITPLDP